MDVLTRESHSFRYVYNSNDEAVNYTAWGNMQPDGADDEDCVTLNNPGNIGLWHDRPCDEVNRYACEREIGENDTRPRLAF